MYRMPAECGFPQLAHDHLANVTDSLGVLDIYHVSLDNHMEDSTKPTLVASFMLPDLPAGAQGAVKVRLGTTPPSP